MNLSDFSLSEFIRYILTGFNFLLFVIALPLAWLAPSAAREWIGTSFLFGLLLCVSVGYLLDILKVYQFTPGFKKNRAEFRSEIAHILGVPIEETSSYFSLVSRLWDAYSPYDLERRRSEWVLTLHTTITLILSTIVWIVIGIVLLIIDGPSLNLAVPGFAAFFSILISSRLLKIADRERKKSNRDIYLIMSNNLDVILGSWSFETQKDAEQSIVHRVDN